MQELLTFLLGYFLGAIPFGLLLTKAAGLGDIRSIGSGNIGATNVLRTGRKDLAAGTLLLDALKGVAAILITLALGWRPEIAGAAAFVGHCFPVWLKFNGGKGVATFLGVILALHFPAGLFACAVWLFIAYTARYSSLAALTAAAASPLTLFVMGEVSFAIAALIMVIVIYVRHHENIKRLITGVESKIGGDKTSSPASNQPA